jgi:hypothetical protein
MHSAEKWGEWLVAVPASVPGVHTPGYVMSPRSGGRNLDWRRDRGFRGSHPELRDVAPFRGLEWRSFTAISPRSHANFSRYALRSAESNLG